MSRAMKDSGIPWIGEIPNDWRICRLKDAGFLYGGLTGKSGDDFNVDEESTQPYLLYIPFTNIFNNSIINPNQLCKVKIEDGEKQNLVKKDDLFFLMSSEDYDGVGKPALLEDDIDNLTLNSFCKGFRITNNGFHPKFLFYHISSHLIRELIRQEAKGFIRINLRQDKLACVSIMQPSISEQQRIAEFLDRKCGEIDETIALQEEFIDELKSYKQSVITEAVTRGLNPNVKFKDSGIDWIGKIPEHWSISRLKFFSRFINGFAFSSDVFSIDKGCKVIRIGDISQLIDFDGCVRANINTDALQPYRVRNNDIVIAMSGATTGKCCIAKDVEEAYINQRVGIIRCNSHSYSYCYYQLQTNYFIEYINLNNAGSAQPNVSGTSIGNFPILVLSLDEQQAIADYLDNKCTEIDSLIAIKQQKIEELKDYKKSIIYEYVTGKKEI